MRRNPVDFHEDIPSDRKPKQIIFYPTGLKLYGVLPYILNRKLKAEFASSRVKFAGDENNFSTISYQQKPENVQALVHWLYEGAGFEWAIAEYGECLSDHPKARPATFKPTESFQKVVLKIFKTIVETQESNAPKPWDVVLGGLLPLAKPQPSDAVLGGDDD